MTRLTTQLCHLLLTAGTATVLLGLPLNVPTSYAFPTNSPINNQTNHPANYQANHSADTTYYTRNARDVADFWSVTYANRPDIITPIPGIKWPATRDHYRPVFYGHRGERFLSPEHTAASYLISSLEGADYVEPDLVLSRDGYLICHHDPHLSTDTDVANHPEFAHKKRTLTGPLDDGVNITLTDWFVHDFTLAELKRLRMKQRPVGVRARLFDNQFTLLTFEEYISIVQEASAKLGRPIGLVPEIKLPKHYASLRPNQPRYFEEKLLSILHAYGYSLQPQPGKRLTRQLPGTQLTAPLGDVTIQCFELDTIQYLRTRTSVPLLYLIGNTNISGTTPSGMDEAAKVVTHIAMDLRYLIEPIDQVLRADNTTFDASQIAKLGGFIQPDALASEAHRRNMRMVVYTISDSHELTDKELVVNRLFQLGVDGLFVENIPEALRLRDAYNFRLALKATDAVTLGATKSQRQT